MDARSVELFEACRPMLTGVAYRVLGSMTDAADVVQDTFLAWTAADRDAIDAPQAWLTTVCSRRAIDVSRAAHRRRVDYVGPWLPDFVRTSAAAAPTPEEATELDASVTIAFLLVLQRLSARERTAFVLHDVFALEYDEVASILDTSQVAARQLVSRARRRLRDAEVSTHAAHPNAARLLAAFRAAVRSGSVDDFAALLAEPVTLSVDSGGQAAAIGHVVEGRREVLAAASAVLLPHWQHDDLRAATFNGQPGLELWDGDALVAAVALTTDRTGLITRVDVVRHPDKLASLRRAS